MCRGTLAFFSLHLLLISLLGKDVDMVNHKEKRSELDHLHSKRAREGVHTVLFNPDARTLTTIKNNVISREHADSQSFHSLKHDEQAVRTARQLR